MPANHTLVEKDGEVLLRAHAWMAQQGYTAERAEEAITSIHGSALAWRMFLEFLSSERPPKGKVAGITYDTLIEKYRLNPANAWVVWAWLHKEPKVAKQALQSGYDTTSLPDWNRSG